MTTSGERQKGGKALRQQVPRSSHGAWAPGPDRPDPIGLLQAQDAGRPRFQIADGALQVGGVGSVGTRCTILLLEGGAEDDALILHEKEASLSVLAPYVARRDYASHRQGSGTSAGEARGAWPAADASRQRHLSGVA